jgi:hypothetical protein
MERIVRVGVGLFSMETFSSFAAKLIGHQKLGVFRPDLANFARR